MGLSQHVKDPWQPAQLAAAFAEFEAVSEHLADSYASLEQRIAELTNALAHSRTALEAELAAKQSLATRLTALLDALPGGVIVLDGRGHIAQYNPAATELLGTIALGESWVAVVARAFSPRWDDGHDVSLVDGRRVNVATAALVGEPGQILLIKDVTETRSLQAQLDHHRRLSAKTELAAVLAHQVRTPLATALLQLGNLNRRGISEAAQDHARLGALEAMRQLERLVNDMLSYARGGVLDAEPISVRTLMDDLNARVTAQALEFPFELTVAPTAAALEIVGNCPALLSVMQNLIDNARLAQAGHLHLKVDVAHDRLQLRFMDRGPGIKPEHRARIFEPFFTTRQNGTGLGLAVARAIAQAHGGDLTLEITAQPGACFVLSLPRRQLQTPIPALATPRQTTDD